METRRTLYGGLHLEAVCPCIVLNDPTEGTCTGVVAWHIEEVTFNGTALDDRAGPEQRETLGTIFGGEAGGHPATLAEFIGEVRSVEAVAITFEIDGKKGNIRVGEVGEAEAAPIEGQDGPAPTVENHPLAIAGVGFIGWGLWLIARALL